MLGCYLIVDACGGSEMKKLPKVQKDFGPVAKSDRLREQTVKAVSTALLAAGIVAGGAGASSASLQSSDVPTVVPESGRVIVLTPPPGITIDDGRTKVAGHV